jgi:hypothetical protein
VAKRYLKAIQTVDAAAADLIISIDEVSSETNDKVYNKFQDIVKEILEIGDELPEKLKAIMERAESIFESKVENKRVLKKKPKTGKPAGKK